MKLTIKSKDDVTIQSASINANGGASVESKNGSVNVVALHDVKIHDVKKIKTGFSFDISKEGITLFKKSEDTLRTEDYISKGTLLSSGKSFKAVFKLENMKMMNYDYKVEISSKGIAKFTSLNNKTWKDEKVEIHAGATLTFWIETENQGSTFE